jgi:hypothetical protein
MATIVKGSSFDILATVYSNWTGDTATSTLANLTGATIQAYFKNRQGDLDSAAVFNKVGSIVSAVDGTLKVTVAASDTNGLSQQKLYYEVVVKMADGTFIRTGVVELFLDGNVLKTLF